MPGRSHPLLTIAIPTWNRAQDLERCVACLAPQVEIVDRNVEILIADNGSTDATAETIAALEAPYSFVRHVRNATNVGPDRNYLVLFEQAAGDYVWLLGDDDFIADGGLRACLDEIERSQPDLLVTNYEFCNVDRCANSKQPQIKRCFATDRHHLDLDALLRIRTHWISCISCVVYRRELLDIADLSRHADVYRHWLQVYAVASTGARSNNISGISMMAIQVRTDNNRTPLASFYREMPRAFAAILRETGVDENTVRYVEEDILRFALPARLYVFLRLRQTPDLPDVPLRYKMLYVTCGRAVIWLWKFYRLCKGRGYSLPEMLL